MTEPENQERERIERNEIMEVLVSNARIEKGIVMDGTQRTLTDEQREAIRQKFTALKERSGVTHHAAAKGIGVQKSCFSQVLSGKYRDKGRGARTIDAALTALDRWMLQREATADAPQRGAHVMTGVAEEIRGVTDAAVSLATMGAVYGPSGIGKSLTLSALRSRYPGSILITITDANSSVTSFLAEAMCHLSLDVRKNRAPMMQAVCNELRGSQRLLMIDEAHLADLKLLNCIRQIHDSTTCPVLFSGQPALAKKLLMGRGDDSMGATLFSRVAPSRDLTERAQGNGQGEPLFSASDVRRVFAKSAIRVTSDAMKWLHGMANIPSGGHLRDCDRVLRLALLIAQKSKTKHEIEVKDLLQASRALLGLRGANDLAKRIAGQTKKEVA